MDPSEQSGESDFQSIDDFLNQFIQKREIEILNSNYYNLNSHTGLDTLMMILEHFNTAFEPLISGLNELLFHNEKVTEWITLELVQSFD